MTSQRLQYRLMVFLGLVSHLCLLLSRKPISAWMNMSAKKQASTNRFIPNKAAGTQFGQYAFWTRSSADEYQPVHCIASKAIWVEGWSSTIQASVQNIATVNANTSGQWQHTSECVKVRHSAQLCCNSCKDGIPSRCGSRKETSNGVTVDVKTSSNSMTTSQ